MCRYNRGLNDDAPALEAEQLLSGAHHPATQSPADSEANSGSSESTNASGSDASSSHSSGALAHMPLGERTEVAGAPQHGPQNSLAARRKRIRAESAAQKDHQQTRSAEEPQTKKRQSKHAPVEEKISRRPVDVVRDAVQRRHRRALDPRFLSASAGGDDAAHDDRVARG